MTMKTSTQQPKPVERTINVHTRSEVFDIRGFFTDYRIERHGDFFVVHFADFLSMRSLRQAFFSCAIDIHSLRNLEKTLTGYVAKMVQINSDYR